MLGKKYRGPIVTGKNKKRNKKTIRGDKTRAASGEAVTQEKKNDEKKK